MAEKFVKDNITNNSVTVFSKSYCPFCTMAKKTLAEAGLENYNLIEIENRSELWSHLTNFSNSRTSELNITYPNLPVTKQTLL